ncbi:MAG TPA: universal stress protein [Gemmatimonadaceae bacterium]
MRHQRSSATRTPRGATAIGATAVPTIEGSLLVAADAGEAMCGPLRLAELLARRDRVGVHVVGVVRPVGLPVWLSIDVNADALEEGRRQRHLEELRRRVTQTVGLAGLFDVEVVSGSPAPTLAAAARAHGAAFVLVGIEGQGTRGRSKSEDDVLQVTRTAHVPVVAAPRECGRLPSHALVAMDFSESSRRAARAALTLLAPDATLTLVHVEPVADLRALGREGWAEIYERGVARLFESLEEELGGAGVRVESVVLEGDPVSALLEYAAKHGCDLIASGTQGVAAHGPCLTGSVSTALLRGSPVAMLVAPPTAPDVHAE